MQGIERSNQRVCNFSAQYVIPVFVIMETRQTRQSVDICEKLLTHFTRVHGTVLSTEKQEYRHYLLNVWIFIQAVANACSKCTTSVLKCRTGAKCRNCAKRKALLAVHSPYVPSAGKSFKRLQARKQTYSQYQIWEYICAWKAPTGDGHVEKWKQNRSLYIYTESQDPRFEEESKKNKSYYSYTLLSMCANMF